MLLNEANALLETYATYTFRLKGMHNIAGFPVIFAILNIAQLDGHPNLKNQAVKINIYLCRHFLKLK